MAIQNQLNSKEVSDYTLRFFNPEAILIDWTKILYNCIVYLMIMPKLMIHVAEGSLADNIKKVIKKQPAVSKVKLSVVLAGDRKGDIQKDILGNAIHVVLFAFLTHQIFHPWMMAI